MCVCIWWVDKHICNNSVCIMGTNPIVINGCVMVTKYRLFSLLEPDHLNMGQSKKVYLVHRCKLSEPSQAKQRKAKASQAIAKPNYRWDKNKTNQFQIKFKFKLKFKLNQSKFNWAVTQLKSKLV